MKPVRIVLLALLGIGFLAVSCGSNGRTAEDPTEIIEAGGERRVDPSTIELQPDEVVWQAHTGGGDVPTTSSASEIPSLTIYGDGRMFLSVPGVDRRFDQPVPVLVDTVSLDELARFLAAAEGTGLFDTGVDFGTPSEPDLPRTVVTLRHRGTELSIETYALGARFDVDLTDEQVDRRESLRLLLSAAEQLATDPAPWTPDRIRILQLADDAPFVESPEADPDDPHPTWPGPALADIVTPTDGGSVLACGELDGAQASRVFDAALENPTPRWEVDGQVRTVVMSAVLPGETACPNR